MTGVLITGARAPVALELARQMHAAGARVVCADSVPSITAASGAVEHAYRVPSARYDPQAFARAVTGIARRHRLDLVVPTCEEGFWLAGSLPDLEGAPSLLAPPIDVLRELHDKARFAELCRRAGVAHPPTSVVRSRREWQTLARRRRGGRRRRIIAKPAYSRFAATAIVVAEGDELPDAPRITPDRPWVVQEWVVGDEVCVSLLAAGGEVRAASVYRPAWRAGRGAAVALDRVDDSDPRARAAIAAAERLAREVGATGFLGFDMIVPHADPASVVVLECNPRATSGLHLFGPDDGLAERVLETTAPDDRPRSAPARAGRRAVRLRGPHLLYALPGVIGGGDPLAWWRQSSASDVISVPGDRIRLGAQAGALGAQVAAAVRMRRSLLAASTHDIEWNGETPSSASRDSDWQRRATSALVAAEPVVFGDNLTAAIESVRVGEEELPVTVTRHDDPRRDRSYVVSPVAHYADYAREELRRLPSAVLRAGLRPVVEALRLVLDVARADDVVMLGNHLVSTNLHADWAASDLTRAVDDLVGRHPASAIAVRSVHPRLGRLPDALRAAGWTLVPARSVLLVPTSGDEWAEHRDVRRDRALLAGSDYEVRPVPVDPSTGEVPREVLERLVELYGQLYLSKHSRLNPRYTVEFLRLAHGRGLLDLTVLARDGRIDGVVGMFAANGWLAAPFLGYDTDLPAETGLYRMLSLLVSDAAHARGVDLHASSGVAEFKRSRGGEPEIEFTAVLTRHLPWRRRLAWSALAALLDVAAVPLLTRYAL